jgi:hypothetical protein
MPTVCGHVDVEWPVYWKSDKELFLSLIFDELQETRAASDWGRLSAGKSPLHRPGGRRFFRPNEAPRSKLRGIKMVLSINKRSKLRGMNPLHKPLVCHIRLCRK